MYVQSLQASGIPNIVIRTNFTHELCFNISCFLTISCAINSTKKPSSSKVLSWSNLYNP